MLLLTKRARASIEDKLKKYFDAPASRGHAPRRREEMEAGVPPPLPPERKREVGRGIPLPSSLPSLSARGRVEITLSPPGAAGDRERGLSPRLALPRKRKGGDSRPSRSFPSLARARARERETVRYEHQLAGVRHGDPSWTVRTLTGEQESGTDTRTPTPGLRTRLKTCVRVHGRCWRRSHPLPPISTPPSAYTHIRFPNVRVNHEPHNGGALRPHNGGVVGPSGGSRQLGSDAALLRSLLPRIRYSPASYRDNLLWVSSSAAAAAGRRRRVPPGDGYCVLPGCPVAAAAAIAAGGCLRKFALL